MTEGDGNGEIQNKPTIVRAVDQVPANDLSDFYTLMDEKFPGKVPIFNWCHRCGTDLSHICMSFLISTVQLQPTQPRMVKGVLLQRPEEVQLTQSQQFVTLTPQRCPVCNWPLWWGPPQNVAVPPMSDSVLAKMEERKKVMKAMLEKKDV